MMMEEYSKSKKKSHNNQINLQENQKFMMNINSNKNGSGIGCVILLGGALITAAAMGSAFFIGRKCRKSIKKITKKEENEKIEDESCKGLHFLLADSSTCIELQQPSSNGTDSDKLSDNDNDSISLFSTPCLIQDEKPKFGMSDEKMDTLKAIVSDHPQEGKSPSFERLPDELELSEIKIALLPDPDQELDEVNQGNEKTEVLAHMHQGQATIFSNPALQVDNKRELLVHNDKGEPNELQHTGIIETVNHEGGLIQEQEEQATGDQETINPDDGSLKETSTCNEHEPLNSAFGQGDQAIKTIELMKAADENEDQDHIHSIYFEQQCADSETQIHQFSTKCDLQIQFSNEEECVKEKDQANSCNEEATSENSPCRRYSIIVQNFVAAAIRNSSIGDEHPTEACEDEDKGHVQITYFEEQCADAETKIDQIAKKCNLKMQCCDDQVCSNENDKPNSCYEEATSENIHCGTYSIDAQNLAASEIKNVSIDDQHSAEVIQMIKETSAMDPSASGEQSPEAEHSRIQLVEKQSFEQNCQGNVLEEDNEASKKLCMDIEVVEKDLEAHRKEVKDEVEESVFVYEEEDDDYDNDVDKDDAAQEVEDDILEGAGNSSEQSNSNKIWAADSSKDISLELKEKKVNEEEDGMKIKEDETYSVENCNLKRTQNDVAITSCQQSYDGKGDSAVNVIERYQMKLMYLHDVAAITRGRRVLLGALLVLIWCFVLKGILPYDISEFKILNQ